VRHNTLLRGGMNAAREGNSVILLKFLRLGLIALVLGISVPTGAQQDISELADEEAVTEFLAEIDEKTRVRSVYGQYSKTKIGDVSFNSGYRVVKRGKQWLTIQFNEPSVPAWVSKDYVNIKRAVASVRVDALNMRLAPTLDSKVLTTLYAGYSSRVLGERSGFVQIYAPASFVVAIRLDDSQTSQVASNQSDDEVIDGKWRTADKTDIQSGDVATLNQRHSDNGLSTANLESVESVLPTAAVESVDQDKPAAKSRAEQQHKIAPGDAISLLVFGEQDLSIENVRVPQSGRVSFPLIGQVIVSGRTTAEVEQSVAALLSQGYVRNPRLSVTIFSYRPIFIRGAVQNTGAFPYTEGLTISKAIALAGGSKNSAKAQGVSILRDGETVEENLPIDSQYQVSSGDVISIAEEKGVTEDENLYIYIHGEVSRPGEYIYRKGLTVEKAIVLASGFSLRASKRKISITRYTGAEADGEPEKLSRVKLFTPIEPGDVIDVGASWF